MDIAVQENGQAKYSRQIVETLRQIESDIARLEALRASITQAGLVRLTDSSAVTDSTGLALPATEKNPGIEGTLAWEVARVGESLSSHYALTGGIEIASESDLDDIWTPGNYYCNMNAVAVSLRNCPVREAFTMKVEHSTGLNYPSQTIRSFSSGDVYYRSSEQTKGGKYAGWKMFVAVPV